MKTLIIPPFIAFAKENCDEIGKNMKNVFEKNGIKTRYEILRIENSGM